MSCNYFTNRCYCCRCCCFYF